MSSRDHAVRVLRRTGFGATGREVEAGADLPVADLVDRLIDHGGVSVAGHRQVDVPGYEWIKRGNRRSMSQQQRRQYRMAAKSQLTDLTFWWLDRMVATDRPFDERLVLTWHQHFATSAIKVRSASLMGRQHATLRRLALGSFSDLAFAMLVDPAMLVWLDGRRNTVHGPNENLSREFMELFALGYGDGYTEADVRTGARALTGWTVSRLDGSAAFDPQRHDDTPKTFLGSTGDFGTADFCRLVLGRDGSAGYVATRTWNQLASSVDPTPNLLQSLVEAYGPGRDLAALVRAILVAPEFAAASGTIVVSPVEWYVGAMRSLGLPVDTGDNAKPMLRLLRSLGQLPFFPPSVAGWPSGQAWLSTASVGTRLRAAGQLAARADLTAITRLAPTSRVEAVVHLLGIPHLTDGTAATLADVRSDPVRLVAVALNTPEYLTH